jgi:hypothetical protein
MRAIGMRLLRRTDWQVGEGLAGEEAGKEMKVRQLIEALQVLDPELDVVMCDGGQAVPVADAWGCYFDGQRVVKLDRETFSLGGASRLKAFA